MTLMSSDDTHQNSDEVCPVKKRSDSAERNLRGRKSGSGMKDLSNVNFDSVPEGEMYESF